MQNEKSVAQRVIDDKENIKNAYGYEDKFRFECQRCGACCNRKTDEKIVVLGPDIYHIAKACRISMPEVTKWYCDTCIGRSSRLDVYILKNKADGMCVLSDKNGCTVHLEKPGVCAVYPFGRIYSEQEDGTIKASYFLPSFNRGCPGYGKGEEKTLREYFETFGSIEAWNEREEETRQWQTLSEKAIELIHRYKGNYAGEFVARNAIWKLLYDYDVNAPLLPQLKKADAELGLYLSGLKRII